MGSQQHDQHKSDWKFNTAEKMPADPLLQSLLLIGKIYRRPLTTVTLKKNVALKDHCLTPESCVNAAKNAGFSAQLLKHPMGEITEQNLPVILLLKNKKACVLKKVESKGSRRATLVFPESGGIQKMPLAELQKIYLGHAIFIRPAFEFGKRSI